MISGTGVPFQFQQPLGSFLEALRATACLTSKHETALRCRVGFDIKLPGEPNRDALDVDLQASNACRARPTPKLPQKKIAKPASSLVRRIS
jgi:hypothetical protein